MKINTGSSVPIYQQIVDQMKLAIAAGVYRVDERIPSARELAMELQVNPNTVQKAYADLADEGVVEPRRGLGNFVTSKASRFSSQQAEKSMVTVFEEGIRTGRSLGLSERKIRQLFTEALRRNSMEGSK